MSAHVLLNLLNKLRKRDKMGSLLNSSHLLFVSSKDCGESGLMYMVI